MADVKEVWAEVRAIHELVQIPESQAREGLGYVQQAAAPVKDRM